MIKRIKEGKGHRYRYYLYVGGLYDGWYSVRELAGLPECVVNTALLGDRLSRAIKGDRIENMNTVFSCMTFEYAPMKLALEEKSKYLQDTTERDEFISFLNSWPVRIN